MKYIGIDPGKSVGFAWIDLTGDRCFHHGTFTHDRLMDELYEVAQYEEVGKIYVEDFRLQKHRQASGDRLLSSRQLGAVELAGLIGGFEVSYQQPEAYRIGAMWGAIKLPSGHAPDALSALSHLWYGLVKDGLITPKEPVLD